MCPPPASLPASLPYVIGVHCSNEQVFMFMKGMSSGSPLPGNVCIDVNPYHCLPSSDFTGDIWFLTDSKERKYTKHGFWKVKGDSDVIFSEPDVTGSITTLEFYEGQAPEWQKTDWMMHEYTMTFKGPSEDSKATEVGTLCRLFSGDEQSSKHEKKPDISSSDLATKNCIQPSHISNADHITEQGSTSKSHVDKEAETTNLTITKRAVTDPPQNQADDNFTSRGDYLELLDLDTPLSPSSSSETMSSNECFDALSLLQDIESEIIRDQQLNGGSCKFSISASLIPNEVVMSPDTSGPLVVSIGGTKSPGEEGRERSEDCSKAGQGTICAEKEEPNGEVGGGGYKCEGASSSSKGTGKRGGPGRKKSMSKYYLCFLPF